MEIVEKLQNPNNGGEVKLNPTSNSKPKVVVIMGATGSGKSKLAIDLASHFPIEIINADSMQVLIVSSCILIKLKSFCVYC